MNYFYNWSPEHKISEAILMIFQILAFPNFSCPLNLKAKRPEYEKIAREYNGKYATQSQKYNCGKL